MVFGPLGLVQQRHRKILDRDRRVPLCVDEQLVRPHPVVAGSLTWLEQGRRAQVRSIDPILGATGLELVDAGLREIPVGG